MNLIIQLQAEDLAAIVLAIATLFQEPPTPRRKKTRDRRDA